MHIDAIPGRLSRVYYMPEKEWLTLSLPALRVYNAFPLASIHSLDSVEIMDSQRWNKKFKMRIEEQVKYNLDFLEMEYIRPKPQTTGPTRPIASSCRHN